MKKEEIMKSVSTTFGKVSVKLKKHSPEILVVAGVVGTVASAVMACHATTKLDSVLEKSKKDIDAVIKGMSEVLLDVIAKNDAVKVGSVVTIGGKHRDARKGHNPATGEAITIEARDGVPYAKFSSVAKA